MNKNSRNTWIMTALIYVIVFAIFNLFVFFVFQSKNAVFWMSYGFCCLAFVVQIGSMLLAFQTLDTETVFLGIPLASLSLYYFFAAVFVGLVFMVFQVAPLKLALFLQILILAAYLVIAIISLIGRNAVQTVNDTVKENVTAIRTLNVDVDVLIPQVSDPALKTALKKLSDTVRYSDPMTNDAVSGIEEQIMGCMNELRIHIEGGENKDAIQTCKDIEVLFLQRNRLLKATK